MIARDVYEDAKRDVEDLAKLAARTLREELNEEIHMQQAIRAANRIGNQYHTSMTQSIFKRLYEVGDRAVDYYAPDLSQDEKALEISGALDTLVHNKYYGHTLPQRIRHSHLNLRNNIRRSAVVGAKKETRLTNLVRVFNEPYPFGSQKSWDTRLFLAEAVRLEHELAKALAARKAQRIVRWTLSHTHSQADVCDRLATNVQPEVEHFITTHNYNIDPHGAYFIEDIPRIPHPNCQCVIKYLHRTPRGRKKTPKKRPNVIQRILSAIFNRKP